MSEFILHTDPLEFQNSRQSTKLLFLQQEIKQLQDHIQDLEQIIKINKEALRITTKHGDPKKVGVNTNDTTASTIDVYSRVDQKQLIQQLQEENLKLLEIIEKVKKERNIAQSKALISEQICEEAQRHEAETVAELEEKINELRKLLQDKEYTIQELEKIKPIPEQEGVVIKFREVMSPTEQNMKLHNELDAVNAMLSKISKELNKCQNEKQEMATLNFVKTLTNELAKIKATFSSPLNFSNKMGGLMNQEGLNNSAGFIIPPVFGFDDENSPFPSPHGDMMNNNMPANKTGNSKAPVPKLDLTKAKNLQQLNAKKIGEQNQHQIQQQADPKIVEKLHHVEEEMEILRKRLSYEIINNKLLSDEIANLQRHNMQLAASNEVLIKSNKRYEEKWQKIFYTLEFYKEFYHKYIDLIANRRMWNRSQANFDNIKLENAIKLKEKFNIDIDTNPDQLIKEIKKMEEENGKQVNVSILEANEDEGSNQIAKENSNNVFQFTKEQCKIYLLNLAKDLYVNTNINKSSLAKQVLKKLEFGGVSHRTPQTIFKLNRSVSNPLDYVSERKKLIFEPQDPAKTKKPSKLKKERKQTRLFDDQNEILLKNQDIKVDFLTPVTNLQNPKPNNLEDEGISFIVDPEEGNKKMVEVSFISEILDQMKNDK